MAERHFNTSIGLIQGAKEQKEHGLARMYFVYTPYVKALLVAFGVPPQGLEDVGHSLFEKVLMSISEFEHGSFRGWLKAITRNTAIDHFRKKQREATTSEQTLELSVRDLSVKRGGHRRIG